MPYCSITHPLAKPTQARTLFPPLSHNPDFPSIRRKHTRPHSLAPVNKRPTHTLHYELNQHIVVKGCIQLPTVLLPLYPASTYPIPLTFIFCHTRQTNFCFTKLIPCNILCLKFHFIFHELSFQQGK